MDLNLNILLQGKHGKVLCERWIFSLSLAPLSQIQASQQINSAQSLNSDKDESPKISQDKGADLNNLNVFFKKLCDQVRNMRNFPTSLPAYSLIQSSINSEGAGSQRIKSEFQISNDQNKFEFPQESKTNSQNVVQMFNQYGLLEVNVEYLSKEDAFSALSKSSIDQKSASKHNPFASMLMQHLGPSTAQLNNPQTNKIPEHNRFRCNSDTTYNCLPASKRKLNKNLQDGLSPLVSQRFTIKEDYFGPTNKQLVYQVSTGQSFSSSHSNLSDNSKKPASPFIHQVNHMKSSTFLKSSLEGTNQDFHEIVTSSSRPSKPRIDPFKKFDNGGSSRNRMQYRLSFDDSKPFNTQGSSSSLTADQNLQRKGSMHIKPKKNYGSLPVQHQLIEEEDQTEFELNIQPDNNNNGKRQSNDANYSFFKITDDNGNESQYSPSPLKSDSSSSLVEEISKNERTPFKFIGLLLEEESNEESSSEEDDDNMNEEEKINKFLGNIQKFTVQNKRQNSQSGYHFHENNKFQTELKKEFFNIVEMREVVLEKNSGSIISLRSRSFFNAANLIAVRGGGGHFHRPDPKLPKPYNFTRRYRLEDINTVLYHDFAPEYHMHLHSPWVQNSKQGVALILIYFCLIILPAWCLATYLHKLAGSMLFPAVRPGPDHAHMAPRLIKHMKENNYENKEDFLGRRNGQFYKNWCRQDNTIDMKPSYIKQFELHGFKF